MTLYGCACAWCMADGGAHGRFTSLKLPPCNCQVHIHAIRRSPYGIIRHDRKYPPKIGFIYIDIDVRVRVRACVVHVRVCVCVSLRVLVQDSWPLLIIKKATQKTERGSARAQYTYALKGPNPRLTARPAYRAATPTQPSAGPTALSGRRAERAPRARSVDLVNSQYSAASTPSFVGPVTGNSPTAKAMACTSE